MGLVSVSFILFILGAVFCYYLIPVRFRKYVILAANVCFLFSFGVRNVILLLGMTILSYVAGWILQNKKSRPLFVAAVIVSLSPLLLFKYLDFVLENISPIVQLAGIAVSPVMSNIAVPVGISFYTFRVVSYLCDRYSQRLITPYSIWDYAIYVSYFPTLLSGPIDRAEAFLKQLHMEHRLDIENLKQGFIQIVYGYFQKLIIADRLAIVVNKVFGNYESYAAFPLFVTSIFYSIQIYCDFAGYSNIAIGIARLMGLNGTQNFMQPYLAVSIKDFWRRWHMSLSSWLRDYIYIPLGGNRRGTVRKYLNLLLTFLISGLWHGVGWKFILWGGLHGVYQLLGEWLMPLRKRVKEKLPFSFGVFETFGKRVITFLLVNFAWVIFWGDSLSTSLHILKNMAAVSPVSFSWIQECGILNVEIVLLGAALLLVFAVDYLVEVRSLDWVAYVAERPLVIRWLLLYGFLFLIILFGVYGPGYDSSQFIYFKF